MQRGIVPDYGFQDLRRWLRRLPIRWRLTLTFAGVLSALLAALIVFVWLHLRSDLVAAGVPPAQRDGALDRLEATLATATPPALLLATFAAYAVTAGALGPVERMRRRAATISAEDLRTRLPLPDTHDEIRRLGDTLNEMLERLQAGLARERLFVASASHELRMPLTVLRAELEVALREHADEDGLRAAVGSAIEETDRISRLAEDMLTLARAEDGVLPVTPESMAVGDLLETWRLRLEPVVAAHGRALTVDISALADGAVIAVDPERAEQVIDNLIDNTLRYGDGPITLLARNTGSMIAIHVHDRGPGFEPALLAHAFDRFTRGDAARRRGGTGLGLAVVRTIATAHGGCVGAENLAGGGADVWLQLPNAGAGI